jgi:hypothetical protein
LAVSGNFTPPPLYIYTPSVFSTPGGSISAASRPKLVATRANLSNAASSSTSPSFIAAYVALGGLEEAQTGVALVPIAGGGVVGGVISTPDTVNGCAAVQSGVLVAGGTNPEAVCTANGTDIYLLDGTTIVKTLTSGAGANLMLFSGGICATCGVVVDGLSRTALISVATADGFGGYQLLNLESLTLSNVVGMGPGDGIAPAFGLLPISTSFFLALTPPEMVQGSNGVDYDIVAIAPTTASGSGASAIYDFASTSRALLAGTTQESAATDSTGIVYSMDELTGNLFLTDLTQASVSTTSPPFTWTAPGQVQNLFELSTGNGSALAVAYGDHTAIVEQEGGGNQFGAIRLPTTSGKGTPAVVDWVSVLMPNDPSGAAWNNPGDAHGVTAAILPYAITSSGVTSGTAHGFGLMMNDARTFVAVVDLDALIAAPRVAPLGYRGHRTLQPTYDLVANNVVSFVPIP